MKAHSIYTVQARYMDHDWFLIDIDQQILFCEFAKRAQQ